MNRPTFKAANDLHPALPGAAIAHLRPGALAPLAPASSESAADRILLTLLALGLMLLAFFVVLTSAATLDQSRIRDVAQSVQASLKRTPAEKPEAVQSTQIEVAPPAIVNALRAAVADAFSTVLSARDNSGTSENGDRINPDLVEIDVPVAVFFSAGAREVLPLELLDRISDIVNAPAPGYRMELVIRASSNTTDGATRLAALAADFVHRGIPATNFSVGLLDEPKANDKATPSLRFTFLLLATDENLAAVRMINTPAAGQEKP